MAGPLEQNRTTEAVFSALHGSPSPTLPPSPCKTHLLNGGALAACRRGGGAAGRLRRNRAALVQLGDDGVANALQLGPLVRNLLFFGQLQQARGVAGRRGSLTGRPQDHMNWAQYARGDILASPSLLPDAHAHLVVVEPFDDLVHRLLNLLLVLCAQLVRQVGILDGVAHGVSVCKQVEHSWG